MKMCCRCHERPAVVFVTKIEGDKTTPEGYCIKCARELNIAPVNDMLNKMNLSDEDLENMNIGITEMMKEFIDPETGEIDRDAVNKSLGEFGNMIPGGMSAIQFMNGEDNGVVEDILAEEVPEGSEQDFGD